MWIHQIFFNFANLIENAETSKLPLILFIFRQLENRFFILN